MKKTGKLMMVLALGILMSLTGCSKKIVEGPRIGVIQLMEHTSLNMIYDSFKEELEALGYKDGKTARLCLKMPRGNKAISARSFRHSNRKS